MTTENMTEIVDSFFMTDKRLREDREAIRKRIKECDPKIIVHLYPLLCLTSRSIEILEMRLKQLTEFSNPPQKAIQAIWEVRQNVFFQYLEENKHILRSRIIKEIPWIDRFDEEQLLFLKQNANSCLYGINTNDFKTTVAKRLDKWNVSPYHLDIMWNIRNKVILEHLWTKISDIRHRMKKDLDFPNYNQGDDWSGIDDVLVI